MLKFVHIYDCHNNRCQDKCEAYLWQSLRLIPLGQAENSIVSSEAYFMEGHDISLFCFL